ncbi:MAG: hypothetical protein QF473_08825 [Planctomycetota bacterium]|nr:hypothetical protein [Planctomycetota bacterium]
MGKVLPTNPCRGLALPIALLLFPAMLQAEAEREGTVQFSDGDTVAGKISLTRGRSLKIHQGKKLMALALERVREIRFDPEEEKMEQKWRFLVAGQTQKEKWGDPYPVRHLKATILLTNDERIEGHLYTTLFYVEGKEKTRKVIAYAKQRGKQGQSLDTLVYPNVIRFHEDARSTAADLRIVFRYPELEEGAELAALTHGALARLAARKTEMAGEYLLPSPLGHEFFVGARSGSQIVVGWPEQKQEKLFKRVTEALEITKDFFDSRTLIGVYQADPKADVYALVMLTRTGKTTLGRAKSQPWRVAILRWKYQRDEDRLMLAGRGFFFRGITGSADNIPEIAISEKLWRKRQKGETILIGEEEESKQP